MKKIRKRYITLLEIMIVIFLIAIIGAIVGVNVKKSFTKAKTVKTDITIEKIKDALSFLVAEGEDPKAIDEDPYTFLVKSPFFHVKSTDEMKKLCTDEKNIPLDIKWNDTDYEFEVTKSNATGSAIN